MLHLRPSRRSRRGVSLLEVLISAFILLFGLVGVAALFPVGKLYVEQSNRYDRAAAVGQAAFNDIQIRGLLCPEVWVANGDGALNPTSPNYAEVVQFDPLPAATPATISGMKRMSAPGLTAQPTIDYVFQSRDDLVVERPADPDSPATQRVVGPSRDYEGNYSWMFTVPLLFNSDLTLKSSHARVSVAVFDRRVRANEGTLSGALTGGYGGGQIALTGTAAQMELLHAGDWVFVGSPVWCWYRVVNVSGAGTTRTLTVAGPDWGSTANANVTIFDRVVAVYDKVMPVIKLN